MSLIELTRQAIDALARFQTNEGTAEWVREWDKALNHDKGGTMRAWMQDRNGQKVDMLQFRTDTLTAPLPSAWAPGARTVDAHATFVRFLYDDGEGSSRYYAGMVVLASSPDTLVVGDESHVVLYRVATD